VRFKAEGVGKFEAAKPVSELERAKPSPLSILRGASRAEGEKRYDEAREIFEEGLGLYPENPTVLNNFAWFLVTVEDRKYRDPERAVRLARKAVDLTHDSAGYILDTLAEALYQAGDLEEAVERAEKAARLDPRGEIRERAERFRNELDARGRGD
jgi:tetratricopeptide (TPR) repeat protein